MMEKLGFFDVIKSFFEAYGWSFLILVGMGFLIAFLCEVTIKMTTEWLEKKWEKNAKLVQILQAVRVVLIILFTWTMSIWCASMLQKSMPLPGNGALFPFWVGLIYFVQFVFSMKGIKTYLDNRKAKKVNGSTNGTAAPKESLVATTVKGVYKNAAGELVDKNGNPVTF